jgi:hypothetical protein
MAALKMMEEQYSDEFKVTACSPMAGPFDLSETQLNFFMRDKAYPYPYLLPYVIFAYNNVYNIYPDLDSVFYPLIMMNLKAISMITPLLIIM